MLALTALALLPLLALAAPTERQNGLTVVNNCYNSGQVALTFDDGPNNREGDIANALNSVGAKGTFFFNGNNYGCIYDHPRLCGISTHRATRSARTLGLIPT